MTQEHQNNDIHWVTHMSVDNRVSGNHLTNKQAICDLISMENGKCLPNIAEHHQQRENYIVLTERLIVEIPCISSLKTVVTKHIPHRYSTEMSTPPETVSTFDL